MKKRLWLGLGVAIAVAIGGCGDKDKQTAVAPPADGMLALVPADTPYAFVSSRPLPRALTEKLLAASTVDFASNKAQFDELLAADPDNPGLKILHAFLSELDGKLNPTGIESLGFSLEARSAFYGIGVLPVLRTEIADATKVRAMIGRVEQNSGVSFPVRTLDGQDYWAVDLAPLTLIVAVTERELIAGLVPNSASDKLLPLALGQSRPERSLGQTDTFSQLNQRHGYQGYGEGFIDFLNLTDQLLGDSQGINAEVLAALEQPAEQQMSPACRSFVREMVSHTPRLAAGLTEATPQGYALHGVLETDASVGTQLERLAAPVPGLGSGQSGLMSFGMAFAVPEVREALRSMMQTISERGADCEMVDSAAVSQGIQSLDLVLNPMVSGIKGFNLRLDDFDIDPDTMSPRSLSGSLLVASEDPRGLFGMLGLLNHEFTQLQVPMDGTPVALPVDNLAPGLPPSYVAMDNKSLVLSFGEGGDSQVPRLLQEPAASKPPLLSISMDIARIAAQLANLSPLIEPNLQGEEGESVRQGLEAFQQSGAYYGTTTVSILGTRQGLVFEQKVQLR